MINNKTVVVLGAGASKPYGYPIGLELRNQIIENFVNWYRESIVNHLRLTSDKQGFLNNAQNFVDTFKKSSNLSIDLFISRNPKFNNIGKLAIVLAIINSEIKSEYRNEIDEPTQDWYSYLYHRMTENLIDKNDISISNNQIDFITFNYDRSFDYFLYDSFNNSFSEISYDKKIQELNKIIIHHINGIYAPIQKTYRSQNYSYKSKHLNYNADTLTKNIEVIYSNRSSELLNGINDKLDNAERVFFLGFGYANENLNALDIPNRWKKRAPQIFGSAFGFTNNEIAVITSKLNNEKYRKSADIKIVNCDCLSLLREYL